MTGSSGGGLPGSGAIVMYKDGDEEVIVYWGYRQLCLGKLSGGRVPG